MLSRRDEILIGLGVMALAALFLWWLIPTYVAIPRRVPNRALAPSFWPNIIGWTMMLAGALLATRATLGPALPTGTADRVEPRGPEFLRLFGMAAIMLVTYLAIPVLGMVWVSMLTFLAILFLTGAKRLGWGVLVAVLLPLTLYFFFTKVAGVAIPQGQIVRLP